jgi:hypothetical protein
MKASDTQIDGDHYKDLAIQPAVFCVKDLRKAQHEIDLLIEIHMVEDRAAWEAEADGTDQEPS